MGGLLNPDAVEQIERQLTEGTERRGPLVVDSTKGRRNKTRREHTIDPGRDFWSIRTNGPRADKTRQGGQNTTVESQAPRPGSPESAKMVRESVNDVVSTIPREMRRRGR